MSGGGRKAPQRKSRKEQREPLENQGEQRQAARRNEQGICLTRIDELLINWKDLLELVG